MRYLIIFLFLMNLNSYAADKNAADHYLSNVNQKSSVSPKVSSEKADQYLSKNTNPAFLSKKDQKNQIIDILDKKNIPHVSVFMCKDEWGFSEYRIALPIKFIFVKFYSHDKSKSEEPISLKYLKSSTHEIVNTLMSRKNNNKYDIRFFSFDIKGKSAKLYYESGISEEDFMWKKPKDLVGSFNFGKTMDCEYRSYQMNKS